MNKISIDCITHPGTTCFYFQTTTPLRMKRIDFVTQSWFTLLTKEYWSLNFLVTPFTLLNIEPNIS